MPETVVKSAESHANASPSAALAIASASQKEAINDDAAVFVATTTPPAETAGKDNTLVKGTLGSVFKRYQNTTQLVSNSYIAYRCRFQFLI